MSSPKAFVTVATTLSFLYSSSVPVAPQDFQPFDTTRLADLLKQGERFSNSVLPQRDDWQQQAGLSPPPAPPPASNDLSGACTLTVSELVQEADRISEEVKRTKKGMSSISAVVDEVMLNVRSIDYSTGCTPKMREKIEATRQRIVAMPLDTLNAAAEAVMNCGISRQNLVDVQRETAERDGDNTQVQRLAGVKSALVNLDARAIELAIDSNGLLREKGRYLEAMKQAGELCAPSEF